MVQHSCADGEQPIGLDSHGMWLTSFIHHITSPSTHSTYSRCYRCRGWTSPSYPIPSTQWPLGGEAHTWLVVSNHTFGNPTTPGGRKSVRSNWHGTATVTNSDRSTHSLPRTHAYPKQRPRTHSKRCLPMAVSQPA